MNKKQIIEKIKDIVPDNEIDQKKLIKELEDQGVNTNSLPYREALWEVVESKENNIYFTDTYGLHRRTEEPESSDNEKEPEDPLDLKSVEDTAFFLIGEEGIKLDSIREELLFQILHVSNDLQDKELTEERRELLVEAFDLLLDPDTTRDEAFEMGDKFRDNGLDILGELGKEIRQGLADVARSIVD